jgi:proline iminopeptidase
LEADSRYLDYSGRDDVLGGGVKMIPIHTPKGDFKVWTKRVGNNPKAKVLLLHGGPAATHEYWEACDSYLPAAGIEYFYYDQLGSAYSDQPDDTDLWTIDRFVDEVEQVRKALDLTQANFYLVGHSWGGILAIEYALRFQEHLKGLVISNMMASIPAYIEYANTVLKPGMDPVALAEIERLEATGEFTQSRESSLRKDQLPTLRVDARAKRARRKRQAGGLGSHRGPWSDQRADPGHWSDARHHGSETHGKYRRTHT